MQYFYSFWLILCLLATGTVAVAKNTNKSNSSNQYSTEFVQNYTQECLQTSMGEGLEKAEADKLCSCTINEFQQQYTQDEFVELTTASATDEKAENTLVEVGQICLEQILYE